MAPEKKPGFDFQHNFTILHWIFRTSTQKNDVISYPGQPESEICKLLVKLHPILKNYFRLVAL